MSQEYPTEENLKYIREFDVLKNPVLELIEYLEEIWHWPDWGFKLLKNGQKDIMGKPTWRLELHTGGWSGNEDIIETLQQNDFWGFCWEKSIRGGHYWIEIPKWLRTRKAKEAADE